MTIKSKNIKDLLEESELLQRAANSSSEGITISSMNADDSPLIYVNAGFERLTGYRKDQVIGRNCRFLQGVATDPKSVEKIRLAIQKGEACTVELLNYKFDGTPFWNRLSITPIRDSNNEVTHYVGIQSDVTELRKTQQKLQLANNELQRFSERITKDLERARKTQQFLLPQRFPHSEKVSFASLFVPMEEIGGDFYDVLELESGIYGMLIADVTGHGIPAALLTFMSSTTFKNLAPGFLSTATAITQTNRKLYNKMPDDAFVTMFYAIYDSHSHKLTYTQAGHPEAYILRSKSQEIIPLITKNPLVGIFSHNEVIFTEANISLQRGDKLILYTDAISDALEVSQNSNVNNAFQTLLLENSHLPVKKLFDTIYESGLSSLQDQSYPDDFTLVGLEVLI
ncbi:MAG: SpoIIE family protein phosphatase [Saprospiraceae bacterium]|nr:SpoIIE family protein phosphatase [Saprospiraceae bacterium]